MDHTLKILKETGALLEGHFIGVSGRHLSKYMNKDALLPHTDCVSQICKMLAELNKNTEVDLVVGPAIGGIVISTWTAWHLSELQGKEVLSIFTEKTADGGQVLKRGYDALVRGRLVLAVEDTVTTGGSVKKAIEAVTDSGGRVVQLSLILNRDPKRINQETFGVPVNALVSLPMESWDEEEVPDWLRAVPVSTEYGHGSEYLDGRKDN